MSEYKVDPKLVSTPVESICGDPNNRNPSDSATDTVYGLAGPTGLSEAGGFKPVLIYDGIKEVGQQPGPAPSDDKQFTGQSPTK